MERTHTLQLPALGALQYREWAAEDAAAAAPVVLLPANPGESRDFSEVGPAIARAGHRVLAFDWPGYGGSAVPADPATVTPLTYYDAFVAAANALQLPPAVLLGNSVGGFVAVKYAAAFPDRVLALALVAPGGFTPHTWLTRLFCNFMGSRWALSPGAFARQ